MSERPRAVIAGASGFIGRHLVEAFTEDGYDVVTIGRHGDATWSDPASILRAVDGADILINLAGKSVNCRYTDVHRNEVYRSRIETTTALRGAVAAAEHPPAAWFNASTATIYRHEMDRPNTEEHGVLGTGFSVDVARDWEHAFFDGDLPATRRVALRMAIVVGDGPATALLTTLARTGLGGPHIDGWWPQHHRYRGIGPTPSGDGRAPQYDTNGRQRFSWIHIDDVVGVVRFLRDRSDIAGIVNLASPNPSDNRTFMATLRSVVGAPFGLPIRRWMLEPAMWIVRTEPELVLKSRWAVPGVLTAAGYRFEQPHLEPALRRTVSSRVRVGTRA